MAQYVYGDSQAPQSFEFLNTPLEFYLFKSQNEYLTLIDIFYNIYELFNGIIPLELSKVSQRWDSSLQVVVASDFDGEAFVSSKQAFLESREFARTKEECIDVGNTQPTLIKVLQEILPYASKLGIPKNEIWVGDILFRRNAIEIESFNKKDFIVFQPDAIKYAIPLSDPLAGKVQQALIGISWSSRYIGDSLDNLEADFDTDYTKLASSSTILSFPKKLSSIVGSITFTKDENVIIDKMIARISSNILQLQSKHSQNELIPHTIKHLLYNYETRINKLSKVDFSNEHSLVEYCNAFAQWAKAQSHTSAKKDAPPLAINFQNLLRFVVTQKLITLVKRAYLAKLRAIFLLYDPKELLETNVVPIGENHLCSVFGGKQNLLFLGSQLEFPRNIYAKELLRRWIQQFMYEANAKNIKPIETSDSIDTTDGDTQDIRRDPYENA